MTDQGSFLPEDVATYCAAALPALKEASWSALLRRQMSWMAAVREQMSPGDAWRAIFGSGPDDYSQWQDPACGERLVNAALDNLTADDDPTITTRRLRAAGELLLGYRGVSGRPLVLPYQSPVRADEIRERSAMKVITLADVNPTLAVEYLARSIEQGENDSPTVGTIVRGIGSIVDKHGDYIDTSTRNRAITVVGSVAAIGAAVYGQFAPAAAARIYEATKKWIGTPTPFQLYATDSALVSPPTVADIIEMQHAVNRVARKYSVRAIKVTAVVDAATTDAVVSLAKQFTSSPAASSIYFDVISAPAAETVASLAPRIARDLNKLADQLGLREYSPGALSSVVKPIAIGTGIAAVIVGVIVLVNRRSRRRSERHHESLRFNRLRDSISG